MPSPQTQKAILPEPDKSARRQSQAILDRVQQACADNGGPIPFSRFMHIALYEPGLGYYSAGLQKFGEQGDFITAPEISPLFTQCLANHVAAILSQLEQPQVIEFGAGSGVMAADSLLHLEKLDKLPVRYNIVEVSASLRQRQQQTIAGRAGHLLDRVTWLDRLPDQPCQAVVLANEVLDAMPVECFRKRSGRVEQMVIGMENGGLFSDYRDAGVDLRRAVDNIEQRLAATLPDDYHSEVNLHIRPWLASIHEALDAGVVLLIDYGYTVHEYYHPERNRGTLMCHYRHRAHPDPFWYPGLQDITAYVDFTDVAHAAVDCGFEVRGFTSQAAFLMASGLADLHAEAVTDDPKQQIRLSQQIKTLTLPSEMGERFKVMALGKQLDAPLPGFFMHDLRGKL